MRLVKRLEKVELKCNIKHRCTLVVAVWDGTEGPTKEQSARFLDYQKDTGQCEKCRGLCVLDWTAEPPTIWRQRSDVEARTVVTGNKDGHDTRFVIGKGYV